MRWWYEPQKEYYEWSEYSDVIFAIASSCRFKISDHVVPNYYIYNENGLFNIIKGSEIDPLSIRRLTNDSNYEFDSDLQLSEDKNCVTFEEEWERINKILDNDYIRTKQQLNEIQDFFEIVEYADIEETYMNSIYDSFVREYKMKNGYGNITDLYVSSIKTFSRRNIININSQDEETIRTISNKCVLDSIRETGHCLILAYKNKKLVGLYNCKDSSDYEFISNICKFITLIGADSFLISTYNMDDYSNEIINEQIKEIASVLNVKYLNRYYFSYADLEKI